MTSQRQPLSIKEIKLVKGIAEGKKKRHAAKAAGYTGSPETLSVTASKTLKKVNVQEALANALREHGITLDAAIAPIGRALTATKVSISGNGESAFAEVVEDIDLQLKGSDRALKLMGIGQQEVTINFISHAQEQRNLYDL